MDKSLNREDRRSAWDSPVPTPASNARILLVAGVVVSVALVALVALFVVRGPVRPGAAAASASSSQLPSEFGTLKGQWLRPDGGYVLELKRLLPQNELEAAYFNPNPIHVGKARLTLERGFVKVFVELRDENYPGSTYTLIYDKASDQLRGIYYQATQQQEYEVFFTRLPGHD